MRGREPAWCILRTAGRATLRLANSLAEDGFEVWTPARTSMLRVPRHNFRREVTLPLMPSFVFARSHQMLDLIELAGVERRRGSGRTKPAHPDFSLFHHFDRIPLVTDADLEPLRIAERRIAPKDKRRFYRPGDRVRVPSGSFQGMHGVVEQSDGRYTLVCFGTKMSVKISTFILQPIGISGEAIAA